MDSRHPVTEAGPLKILTYNDYTIGWIAALKEDLSCASAMLDERHEDLDTMSEDTNSYILGRIGKHNVVIAGLPHRGIGTIPAANVAINILRTFKNLRFSLMISQGGGVLVSDMRLGDTVVSTPTGITGMKLDLLDSLD